MTLPIFVFQQEGEQEAQVAPDGAFQKVSQEIATVKRQQVENAIAQVTALASADAGEKAVLASLDMLIGVASQLGHRDLPLFQNLRAQALRLKDQLSVAGLCLDVLVGKTDDRLALAVNKGLKETKIRKKAEGNAKDSQSNVNVPVEKSSSPASMAGMGQHNGLPQFPPPVSPLQGLYPPPFPQVYGQPPQWPFAGQAFPQPLVLGGGSGNLRPQSRRRVMCHACQKEGHMMRECPLLQKLRERQ